MLCMVNGGVIANFSKNFQDRNPTWSDLESDLESEPTWSDFQNAVAESTASEADSKKLQEQIFSKPRKMKTTNPLYVFFSDLTGRFNKD